MTMTESGTHTQALLDQAASLLDAIGAADAASVPPEVLMLCLSAATYLELAGGRARRAPLVDGDPRATIRAAMTALSQLDLDTFGAEPVLEAARSARRALRLMG